MAKFTKETAKNALYKRWNHPQETGRYIVTYTLNRKNAKRHQCYRAKTLKECAKYIQDHAHLTDRYYQIYDYDWRLI